MIVVSITIQFVVNNGYNTVYVHMASQDIQPMITASDLRANMDALDAMKWSMALSTASDLTDCPLHAVSASDLLDLFPPT